MDLQRERDLTMSVRAPHRIIVLLTALALVVELQYAYDRVKPAAPAAGPGGFSASAIRMFDFGFHAAVASFLWVPTMPEVLDLWRGRAEYLPGEAFVNAVDPKLSYPYAFSVLTLPAVPQHAFPDRVRSAQAIGERGLHDADPDWRIPYYMATNYYLEFKDKKDAQRYYDIAARTPGVPGFAKRFALNFGIGANERQTTEELWATIRDSANDDDSRDRAQAYIDRLKIFDYLEAAANMYRQTYGAYPASPNDLVVKKIVPDIPQDPFGFTFILNSDGTAGIDLTKTL